MLLASFEMVEPRLEGRRFATSTRARLGDVTRGGELRLDALVRYTQEISNDDTNDAGLEDDLAWVARSTVVDLVQAAGLDETLALTTFCAGLGRTWAERRVRVIGDRGAHYDVATLWISIDPATMGPRRLSPQFLALYGEAAGDRKVSAKQRISRPDPMQISEADRLHWIPRWGDFDSFGHMNNVVYWSALQHGLGSDIPPRTRLLIEHGAGVQPTDDTVVAIDEGRSGLTMWWLAVDATGTPNPAYLAAAQLISLAS